MIKLRNLATLLFIAALPTIGFSQTQTNGKVLIAGTRFTYPLVEKWISEFKKSNPGVEIGLLPKGSTETPTLKINAYQIPKEELKEDVEYIHINRYLLLPIANSNHPLKQEYLKKGVKDKDIKQLFFEGDDEFASEKKKDKSKSPTFATTIYTREQRSCAPIAFANYYGFDQDNIKGKSITGDDKFLIQAIKKDSSGITYNNLGYIYDLSTRAVVDGLTVIPFDINENGKLDADENFYGSLDEVVTNLENSKKTAIPVEHVNISFAKEEAAKNNNLKLFLKYVLTEGQQFNHQYGFLNLEEQQLTRQKNVLNAN